MVAVALTPEQVVDTARDLIRTNGLDSFSMRKLAAMLDVNPMTIYLRFANKHALLQAVAAASLRGIELPPATGPWDQQAADLAIAIRAHLVADRELLRFFNDPAHLSGSVLGAVDRGLELMTAAGYRDAAAVDAFRQVFWHAVGGALVAASFEQMPATTTDLSAALAATPVYPNVAAHAEHFGAVDRDQLFADTTRTLVAGLVQAAPQEMTR